MPHYNSYRSYKYNNTATTIATLKLLYSKNKLPPHAYLLSYYKQGVSMTMPVSSNVHIKPRC